MSHVVAGLRRLSSFIGILLVLQFSIMPSFSFAAGPTGPTGPQGPTGPTGATGRQVDTQSSNPVNTNQVHSEINNTGPESDNSASTTNTSETNSETANTGNVNNVLNADLVTGQNGIDSTTNAGPVTTGNIEAGVDMFNTVNSQLAEGSSYGSQILNGSGDVTINPSSDRITLGTNGTGPGSTNSNTANQYSDLNLLNQNDAITNNQMVVNADTGTNTIQNTTGVDSLTTGDIDLALNVLNLLNVNAALAVDVYNILGNLNGNINIGSSNTGPDSLTFNGVDSQNNTSINVRNNADLNNQVEVNANTGENKIEDTTSSGEVKTGSIDIEGAITNIANISNPLIYVVNVFGKFVGNIFDAITAPEGAMVIVNEINDTGEDSETANEVNATNNNTIDSINNAEANNNIVVNANTGRNSVKAVTDMGPLTTGNIKILSNITNIANITGKLTVGVINIMGDWFAKGKKSPPPKTTEDSQTFVQVPVNNGDSQTLTNNESIKSNEKSSSPKSLIEKIINKAPGQSTTSTENSVANQITENLPVSDENVLVQSYSTGTETAKAVSKQLLYLVFAGGFLLLLWVTTELITARAKKNTR